ncbi:MAG: alpha/beta hydrolase [Ruminococcus sp.]|nr:alpha/beta hydrolase [Ruminococcus sp.]
MELMTKLIRMNLSVINKLADICSVERSRSVQDKIGSFMAHEYQSDLEYHTVELQGFQAEYIIPKETEHDGIILYLHGGGYVSGNIEYARGFGSLLSVNNHIKVLSVAYRLAPENIFPAALDDALIAYRYLIENGYSPDRIVLCGESAGGGLVFSLALKLKEENLPLPCGIIAVSPWSDLSMSGDSYEENREKDPSMTKKRLQFYAKCYTEQVKLPLVSPLFADLTGLPPSLIFVGGDEIMLSDSVDLHKKICEYGCKSSLNVAPDMWHIYLLYGIKQAKNDLKKIPEFLREVFHEGA